MKKIKSTYIAIIAVIVLFTLIIPFLINESYKVGKGYVTMWEASDVLSFYGSYLSFFGTLVLGIVAVYQNKQAQKLNE